MRWGRTVRSVAAAAVLAGILALAACSAGAPSASSGAVRVPLESANRRQGEGLEAVYVQRGGFAVNLTVSEAPALAEHLPQILFLASRGFWGEARQCPAPELPAVDPKAPSDDPPSLSGCWVRFSCRPFIPAAGQNAWPHGDVILYLDQGTAEDAFLAIQSPTAPERWRRVRMAGYGPWLCKEVEMLTRTATGL